MCKLTRLVLVCGFRGSVRQQEADSTQDLETTLIMIKRHIPQAQVLVYRYVSAEELRPGWIRKHAGRIIEDLMIHPDNPNVSPPLSYMHADLSILAKLTILSSKGVPSNDNDSRNARYQNIPTIFIAHNFGGWIVKQVR